MVGIKGRMIILVFVVLSSCATLGLAKTTYSTSCPQVERIIWDTVTEAYRKDNTEPAGLLRLHFHDCFVEGCDASVLLSSTPLDGTDVERFSLGNNNSVRGFEVIDQIKTKLEAACPGVVSCADIVAIAARDSVVIMNGPYYTVPTGRYDGTRSSKTKADAKLPGANLTFPLLKDNFAQNGLSVQDLVLLSGGHTIGRTKCRAFERRVHNFNATGRPDPELNPEYVPVLKRICNPPGANPSPTVPLDRDSEFTFDNTYYKNLVLNNGLLTSDQALVVGSSEALSLVNDLANDNSLFFRLYAESMINMGNIGWKTSANGEIRSKCSAVNESPPSGESRAFE